MRNTRFSAKSTMQSMSVVLGRLHRLLQRAGTSYEMIRQENKKYIKSVLEEVYLVRVGSLLYPELLHQEGPTTRSQVRKERR